MTILSFAKGGKGKKKGGEGKGRKRERERKERRGACGRKRDITRVK